MAAYWTIQHAIEMKVSGVGFSVDVFVIAPSDKTFIARQLDETEVREHVEFIKASEEALRGVREAMTAPPAIQAPVAAPPTLKPQSG